MKFSAKMIIILLVLGILVTTAAAINPGWQGEWYVDSNEVVGDYTSIALNHTHNPCISYHNTTGHSLKYAEWNGFSWTSTTVDNNGDVGYYTSLALDSSGYPHISYYDNTGHDLKYAEWTGTTWATETVDSVGDVGKTTSIKIDGTGKPWISYYDKTNTSLKCATKVGTMWVIGTVDNDGDVGSYTSLALDGDNHPHISYYDASNTALKYAEWTTAWVISTVDNDGDVGRDSSLALYYSDSPHISYYDESHTALKYAEWNGASWARTTIDDNGDVGTYTSLTFDGLGMPWISYYDASYHALKCANKDFYKNGRPWVISTVDTDPLGVGMYSSIASASPYTPHISYYVEKGALKYIHRLNMFSYIGTYRPSTHAFYLDWNGNGRWDGVGEFLDRVYDFGLTGDLPAPGAWKANSATEIGVYRPSTHTFYLDYNGNGRWDGAATDKAFDFGLTGDLPVSGFWDGDGLAKIGTFRPSTHTFYLDYNGNGRWDGVATDKAFDFGLTGDLPVSNDWNGDGCSKIGVYRPSTHTFYLDYNGNGRWDGATIDGQYNFGLTGDQPVPGFFDVSGGARIAVFRPSTHTFYLDWNGNGRWDGAVIDLAYSYGLTDDKGIRGHW